VWVNGIYLMAAHKKTERPFDARILPVRDGYNDRRIPHWLFDLPARVCLTGRSAASGKTTALVNILGRFYPEGTWAGRDCWIISGTAGADPKVKLLQRMLRIPNDNISSDFSDGKVMEIYDEVKRRSLKDTKKHFLLILDDIAFHLDARQNQGAISELAMQSRHYSLSVFIITQRWSSMPTSLRLNLSGVLAWGCSIKEQKALCDDLARVPPKDFYRMFRAVTSDDPHAFLVVRPNRRLSEMYLDDEFQPIDPVIPED
jgi:hypothetical protein